MTPALVTPALVRSKRDEGERLGFGISASAENLGLCAQARPSTLDAPTPSTFARRRAVVASSALQTFMEPAAVGRGAFLPSLVAVCRSQKEPRHRPPDVSPLRDPSAFGNEDEHNRYVKERRKAKERLREFRRPPRDRKGRHQRGRAHPSRASVKQSDVFR